jgi:hypothetical protein
MSIPRLVLTPELLGKTLGMPDEAASQHRYLEIGLNLLVDAPEGNTWIEVRR